MGNYKFKLSELIPNAWFYKLKDMGKSSRKPQKQKNTTLSPSSNKKHHAVSTSSTTTTRSPRLQQSRRSSYYSRPDKTTPSYSPADDTPVKSPGNKPRHRATPAMKSPADPKLIPSSAVSSTCSCRTKTCSQRKSDFITQLDFSTTSGDSITTGTGSFSPEFRSDQILIPDESSLDITTSPCSSIKPKSPTLTPTKLDLRPIITKSTPAKRSSVNSPAGIRLRLRSPRISARKSTSRSASSSSTLNSRRSRAVVKTSLDPKRDFKESMMEMIVENKIRASKDLEELLACYLCLNSDEYHDIIINVFKQIWLDLKFPLSISK